MRLVDGLPGMAYRCRNEPDWPMEFVSAGAEELTGHAPDELTADGSVVYGQLIHPDDRERVWHQVQTAVDGGERFQISYRIRTAAGETKWVWEQGHGVVSDSGDVEHVEGFIIDVTERRQSEERSRRMFENSPMGMYIYDLGATGELVLVDANPAADEILGIEHSALVGKPIEEAFPGLATTEIPDRYREVAEDGGTWEAPDVPYQHGEISGAFEVHAFQARPGQMAVMFQDISERKEREQELRQLWMAVEQGVGSVMITDLDGKIEYANPYFEELTGYGRNEVLGKNPRILESGEHDDSFFREMWDTIKAGNVWTGTFINKKKDGTVYHEEQTITPVRDESGEIAHFVSVGRDMTKERELEEQVLRSQRMESVGRLAGGIAHDFNNMVTGITAYAQLLLARDDLDESARQDLQQIRSAADRTAHLAHQLLSFSRKQDMELSVLDLNDLVEGMSKMLQRLIRDDVKLTMDLEPDLWNIEADPSRLDQVLMNLAINASDAMPEGGELVIETSNVELDEPHTDVHLGVEPGQYVLLTVTDDGIGMDRKTASRIFEPFFTTKEEGEGTGLGLSTSYGIVQQHGGSIWVYSEPGEGTTFKIYLPRVEGERKEYVAEDLSVDSLQGSETVLLVEDDKSVLQPVRRVLESFGYTVLVASRAEEAVRIVEERKGEIDLLFTDVMMPEIGGGELAEQIRAEWPEIKVLLMSGYGESSVQSQRSLKEGAAFLRKPFTPREIGRKVREVLDQGAQESP